MSCCAGGPQPLRRWAWPTCWPRPASRGRSRPCRPRWRASVAWTRGSSRAGTTALPRRQADGRPRARGHCGERRTTTPTSSWLEARLSPLRRLPDVADGRSSRFTPLELQRRWSLEILEGPGPTALCRSAAYQTVPRASTPPSGVVGQACSLLCDAHCRRSRLHGDPRDTENPEERRPRPTCARELADWAPRPRITHRSGRRRRGGSCPVEFAVRPRSPSAPFLPAGPPTVHDPDTHGV